jgi:hypothetical protein
MPSVVYNNFKAAVLGGNFSLSASDPSGYNLILMSGYSPDIVDDVVYSDISSLETSGTGYTAGGKELSAMSLSADNTNDRGVWDSDDVTFSDSTITADGAVLYKVADGNLICYIDFGSFKSSSAGDFNIAWNVNGILTLN